MALTTDEAAELARLRLAQTSPTVTRITSGSRTIENKPADPTAVQRRIDELEARAASTAPTYRRRGALGFRV